MNYQKLKYHLIIALIVGVTLWSCRGPRAITPERAPLGTAEMTLMEVHTNHADFDWFSSRISGSVVWEDKTHPLGGTMRIRRDSAIYISIAPILGIEIARAIITPDSFKLVNRLESTYYLGNLAILSKMFNADVDYYMLQSLLTGNDFTHFRNDQFEVEAETPLIRLQARQRLRTNGQGDPIRQILSVNPENMRIRTNIVEQPQSGRVIRADYRRHETIDRFIVPVEIALLFQEDNSQSNLEITFSRTNVNVPQNMQFSVPARYTPIVLTP